MNKWEECYQSVLRVRSEDELFPRTDDDLIMISYAVYYISRDIIVINLYWSVCAAMCLCVCVHMLTLAIRFGRTFLPESGQGVCVHMLTLTIRFGRTFPPESGQRITICLSTHTHTNIRTHHLNPNKVYTSPPSYLHILLIIHSSALPFFPLGRCHASVWNHSPPCRH